jgi:eukaryotic-like serine/threonine-protein kinase
MGTVYEAVQLELERTVAIKVLPAEAAGDAKANARLRQEAMAAARLGHPNVVEVFELGTAEDGAPFIVMERLVGTSLRGLLVERRRLPIDRAVHIALQMLDALGVAHAAGIVHRDVKPANVMLLDDDRVKLVDFGIARFTEDERSVRTTTGTLLGTPAYLAPEQLDARGVDGRTDLHAVGLCLFEMLLGARPWRGAISDVASAVLRTIPPRIDTRRDDVPSALADVVERALAKEPNARFASASEMSAALRAAVPAAKAPMIATRAPAPAPAATSRPRARSPMPIAVALVVVLGAAGAVTGAMLARTPKNAEPPAPPVQTTARTRTEEAPPVPPSSVNEVVPPLEDDAAVGDPPVEPPAKRSTATPAGPTERVLCNDPRFRFGQLCGILHPDCHCRVRDEDFSTTVSCAVPFVNNDCPTSAFVPVPKGAAPNTPCPINLSQRTGDGGGKTWIGTGLVTCEYCDMSQWYNEPPRYGVVGAACTGINHRGQTVTGKYLRYTK